MKLQNSFQFKKEMNHARTLPEILLLLEQYKKGPKLLNDFSNEYISKRIAKKH